MLRKMMAGLMLGASLVAGSFSVSEFTPVAQAAQADLSLGGVSIGTSMATVRNIYGEPGYKEQLHQGGPFGNYVTWVYGGTFKINFDGDDYKVFKVETTANNGIKLPENIGVGDNIELAQRNYPSLKKVSSNQYRWSKEWIYIMFDVDNDNKIKKISLYCSP